MAILAPSSRAHRTLRPNAVITLGRPTSLAPYQPLIRVENGIAERSSFHGGETEGVGVLRVVLIFFPN